MHILQSTNSTSFYDNMTQQYRGVNFNSCTNNQSESKSEVLGELNKEIYAVS